MALRVLIADEQQLMRSGFRMILEEIDDFDVVGEAQDGAEAIRQAVALSPDVVLMDVRMPVLDGIEATRRIIEQCPSARILILTTFDLDEYAFAALDAGANGFVLKDVPVDELVRAIRAVASGDAVLSPRVTRRVLELYAESLPMSSPSEAVDSRISELTPRETQILLEVAIGLSNAEIASKLVLSEATVKTHVSAILTKLGLRSRVQVVIWAYTTGFVT